MTDYDDVEREARHDWLDQRGWLAEDERPSRADIVDDTCQLCSRVLGNHEGPVCNRCMNEA